MPPAIQRRPSEPLYSGAHAMNKYPETDPRVLNQKAAQQQQHREALRLALGSILAPKRAQNSPSPRPSSGTASPAYPFSGSVSGTHTPSGTPPIHYSSAHGPHSTDYLHPSHAYPHGPSKLGRTTPNSVSPTDSSPNSAHPSPRPTTVVHPTLPSVNDIEPMPLPPRAHEPEMSPGYPTAPAAPPSSTLPLRPPVSPSQATNEVPVRPSSMPGISTGKEPCDPTRANPAAAKSTFLQTLQSKSAWDALIHGSFS